jgi:predicted dehydrogenase
MPTLSRRHFLTATAASLAIVPRHVLGGPGYVAPSDKVNIALVGAGGQGRTNLRSLFKQDDAQVIAIVDPAEHLDLEPFYYRGVAGRIPVKAEIEKHYADRTPNHRCAEYEDVRAMLEKEKAVDAILCATPDHLHAYVSVLAMRAGKHVYCEKPLTHNIWEARYVAKVAKETGVATQMGNQGHSTDTIRDTCEMIWAGAIGPVRTVHAWVGAGRWNPTLTTKPDDRPPLPSGLNWSLWLGPREPRPYHPAYFPVAWRDFWAFGGSNIADFGCHDLDSACWALHLAAPSSVEFHPAGPMDDQIAPHGCLGQYRFFPLRGTSSPGPPIAVARGGPMPHSAPAGAPDGARSHPIPEGTSPSGDQPEVTVNWYDGGLRPMLPEQAGEGVILPPRGVLFVGDSGVILTGGAGGTPRLLPAGRAESFTKPPQTLTRSKGHHRDWLDACKGGPPASSHFEYGARLTELALLGVLALRLRQRVDWDAAEMEARGIGEAEPIIREPYRQGWEIDW